MAYLKKNGGYYVQYMINSRRLTSSSILGPSPRTGVCQSCKGEQYQGQEDRPDWDRSASNRSKGALSKDEHASLSQSMLNISPFDIVNAGDHWSLRMSRQMEPFALILGW